MVLQLLIYILGVIVFMSRHVDNVFDRFKKIIIRGYPNQFMIKIYDVSFSLSGRYAKVYS